MFAARFFARRYFAPRYFAEAGETAAPATGMAYYYTLLLAVEG